MAAVILTATRPRRNHRSIKDRRMDKTRKYYAVRRGRKTGIFDTWNECAEQVHKYGGAVYKAFTDREAAERYLHEDDGTEQDGGAVAYIDGSYSVARGLYAWGGFIDDGAAVYVLQGTGNNADYLQYRNITGEIRGALDVMEKAKALQLPEITIYHDCEGVGRWALGEWKCNNELTAYYREYFKRLQERGGPFSLTGATGSRPPRTEKHRERTGEDMSETEEREVMASVTKTLHAVMQRDEGTAEAVDAAFKSFLMGEWGDIPESDKRANEQDIKDGAGRILARYKTPSGDIYIIQYVGEGQPMQALFCSEY